jgi:phospholipid/cholesterol/gamma-HCH transport system substrate-binding protein
VRQREQTKLRRSCTFDAEHVADHLESEAVMSSDAPRSHRSPENKAWWVFAIILLLGGAAALAWFYVDSGRYATYQIRTHDPVSGLLVDAPVEFHGVDVGKVARVELIDPKSVSVLLHIRKDVPVTAATVATITSRGLASKGFTGYVYVSLEDDAAGARPVAQSPSDQYPQIRTAAYRSVNMDTAISQVNENVQHITSLLQTSLDANTIASLKQSLDSMQKVTRTLADNSERMNSIILNAERVSSRLDPLLASGSETARVLQTQLLPEAHRALANLDRLSTSLTLNAERASSRLDPLLESGNETTKALQTQLLPQAYEALAKLDRLATTLNAAATRIERDPSLVVRGTGKRPPGPGETQ